MKVSFKNTEEEKMGNPSELRVGQGILFELTDDRMVHISEDLWVIFGASGVKETYTKSGLGSDVSWSKNRRLLGAGDSITLGF